MVVIGVLALQGAFAKHKQMVEKAGAKAVEVRKPADLLLCDGLIIPGGESTTIMRQINFIGMKEALLQFAENKPLFGTCAGLILMAKQILADQMQPLGLLDITVERNAFGRQSESFTTDLPVELKKKHKAVKALFIRAPRIRSCGENVQILAKYEDEPVLVQQGKYLAATFHPELTEDASIHEYFIHLCHQK